MLSPREEVIVEHALQVFAPMVSLGRGAELPPTVVLEEAVKAISGLKLISGRYGEVL